jgi:hypothetical protein
LPEEQKIKVMKKQVIEFQGEEMTKEEVIDRIQEEMFSHLGSLGYDFEVYEEFEEFNDLFSGLLWKADVKDLENQK